MIGLSAGALRHVFTSVADAVAAYESLGCDAIEFRRREDVLAFSPRFAFVTLHAPKMRVREWIASVRDLGVRGITIHPDVAPPLSELEASGLPFLIENMDAQKRSGHSLEELRMIRDTTSLGFVLDVQHLHEHDPSMGYANDVLEIFGERIHHLHVSGRTPEENHVPLYRAPNREAVLAFTKEVLSRRRVPIILEGDCESVEDAGREMAFMREHVL